MARTPSMIALTRINRAAQVQRHRVRAEALPPD